MRRIARKSIRAFRYFGGQNKDFSWTSPFKSHNMLRTEMGTYTTSDASCFIKHSMVIFQGEGFHRAFLHARPTPNALLIVGFRKIGGHGMEGPDAFIEHAEYAAAALATTADPIEVPGKIEFGMKDLMH